MWAPLNDRAGHTPHHWQTMSRLMPGDIVFSYWRQKFPALCIVRSQPYSANAPTDFQRMGDWSQEGLKVDTVYDDIASPLPISSIREDLMPLLPAKYSPLNKEGDGNQGYLFELPPVAGRYLLDRIGQSQGMVADDVVAHTVETSIPDQTERESVVKSRIGQGKFRDDLIEYWQGKCAVTGFGIVPVLRASHIKPWRDGTNEERLDPFNGLLLSPAYDALFDIGLISFADDDLIMVSGELRGSEGAAGISASANLSMVDDRHRKYLTYHREVIYQ